MLIIPVKDGENIDRALKRYKRKFDRTKTMKNLRSRKQFEKPSVVKRAQGIKAQYVQRLRTAEEQA
ncbi:30S ribosomal protein S21 [Lutibacter maritimus]|jgi:small subunit ribosomal protein S21|uniref:Small ribosomal subunit protein bS21 n=1 Tax=Lutibacter maritimus TaxID=593133 RepID=A0A1I6SB99_9FLAO|nr:30S ribosomal protein S21 [Lutibacter maritimus]SFS74239.1 small subunit ribosomal protein S21 [Lutibacter maritimus]